MILLSKQDRTHGQKQEAPLTMTEATLFLPGLSPVGGKTITATFDGGKLSSNGGVLLLRDPSSVMAFASLGVCLGCPRALASVIKKLGTRYPLLPSERRSRRRSLLN